MVNSTEKNPSALTTPLAAPSGAPEVAGVDGCRAGWLAVRLDPASGRAASAIYPDWPALARACGDVARICVDMPIGLADSGARPCDRAARAMLPRARKSSVFPAPRRYMLGLSYHALGAAAQARGDAGLSIQAFNIMPKIAELDAALRPADQDRVLETHPELAYHRLNAGAALPRKAERAGRDARQRLLIAAGLTDLDALLAAHRRQDAKPDDVLDAAVCALVARDQLAARARRVPDGAPARDARGLRMEIWY
jgi:predicted RNase H-like nuclease